jgi:hypothetical protein
VTRVVSGFCFVYSVVCYGSLVMSSGVCVSAAADDLAWCGKNSPLGVVRVQGSLDHWHGVSYSHRTSNRLSRNRGMGLLI